MTSEENANADVARARSRRRRRWWLAGAVVLVVLVVGAVVAYFVFRESTTPVDVAEAVDDFRREESTTPVAPETTVAAPSSVPATTNAGSGAPTTESSAAATTIPPRPGSGRPEPGVYTYATSGTESIDALGGRSHDYPQVSTITVTHQGCGAVFRWRPLRERWDTTTLCPSPEGMELRVDRNHHEFFNIGDTRRFECEPGALFFPATTSPGATWTARCSNGPIDVVRAGTIVGTREVEVGGTPVTVLEFEVDDTISGASNGTTQRTVRVVPETGLIVELALVLDVQNESPIGDVHYQERYRIELTSLEPRG
jgi:hypothetical protein